MKVKSGETYPGHCYASSGSQWSAASGAASAAVAAACTALSAAGTAAVAAASDAALAEAAPRHALCQLSDFHLSPWQAAWALKMEQSKVRIPSRGIFSKAAL